MDVKTQLDENAAWIKGHYTYELELINREIQRLTSELDGVDQSYEKTKDKYNSAVKYEKELISSKSQLSAKVELLQVEVDGLVEVLFEDAEVKSPTILIDKVEEKNKSLKKKLLDCEQERLKLLAQVESMEQSIEVSDKGLNELRSSRNDYKDQDQILQNDMDKLKVQLEKAGYHLYLTGDLYGKEDSLLSELEEQKEVAFNKKERALKEERKHMGLADIYGDMSQFSVEPILAEIVEELKSKTSFIAMGTSHLNTVREAMNLTNEALFEAYPYWCLTIVCSITEESMVRDYVMGKSDQLTSMVHVVTIEGLNQIISEGLSDHLQGIYPSIWYNNLDNDNYYEWQQKLTSSAEEYLSHRIGLEQVLYDADLLMRSGRKFFEEHTYDSYKEIKAQIEDIDKNIKHKTESHNDLVANVEKDKELIREIESAKDQIEEELKSLDQVLTQAKYLKAKDAQLMEVEQNLHKVEKQYFDAVKNLEGLTNQLEAFIEERHRLMDERQKYYREEDKVQSLELYNAVKEAEAVGTTTSIEVLKDQRHQLERELIGVKAGRGDLEDRLKQLEELEKRYSHDFEQKKSKEALYPVEILQVFYDDEADKLFDTLTEISGSIQKIGKVLKQKEVSITQKETRCQILKEKM